MSSNEREMELLADVMNQGMQSGVDVLNQMLETEITLAPASIRELPPAAADIFPRTGDAPLTVVEMGFGGGLSGNSGLVFEDENAWIFVEKVAGNEVSGEEFDFISAGVVTEIGNIVLNRVMGAISNALSLSLDYVVPAFFQGEPDRLWKDQADAEEAIPGVVALTRFEVAGLATSGNIVIFFNEQSYQTMLAIVASEASQS